MSEFICSICQCRSEMFWGGLCPMCYIEKYKKIPAPDRIAIALERIANKMDSIDDGLQDLREDLQERLPELRDWFAMAQVSSNINSTLAAIGPYDIASSMIADRKQRKLNDETKKEA